MNNDIFISRIAEEQNINNNQVQAVASLFAEGATIPFIARYRKEATGSLDEIVVAAVRDRLNQLKELEERKLAILKSLEKHDHLTDELQERILAVESMAKDLGVAVVDILKKPDIRNQIDVKKYVTDSVGIPTLNDILDELAKPGRDPREKFEAFSFADGIEKIEDLRPGMKLPGIVTNITAFGAFVDIGVHQDGLVHISQIADRFVKNPADIVKVQQKVLVTVLEVDLDRKRISLSMKSQAKKSVTAVENPGLKKVQKRNPKPKNKNKKKVSSKPAPFNNPLAEALIKSGLK